MDYFSIIDVEERYDIDKADLEIKYLELQKKYHPDKTVSPDLSSDDVHNILYKALEINTAYNVLSDDLKRAIYLLKMYKFDIENESEKIPMDRALLNDIFTQREYIEHLTNQDLLNEFLDEINQKIDNIIFNLSELFAKRKYLEALQITVQFKYVDIIKKLIIKKLY